MCAWPSRACSDLPRSVLALRKPDNGSKGQVPYSLPSRASTVTVPAAKGRQATRAGEVGMQNRPPLEHISGAGMGVLAQARFPSSVLKCTGHLGVFGDSDEIPREGVSWRPRQGAPPQFSCFHLPPPARRVSAFFPNVCGLLGPTDGYAHRQLPRDAPPRPGCTHGFRTRAGSSIPVPGGHVPGLLSQNPPLPPPGHCAEGTPSLGSRHLERSWEGDPSISGAQKSIAKITLKH